MSSGVGTGVASRQAAVAPAAASQAQAGSRRLFAVLFGINVLNYADRFTLPAVAPLLVASTGLGLTDTRLGLLGTAFLLVYALTAPPLGALADRAPRTRIVGVGVAIWSIATALTALARTFPQLFVARAVLGVGEASYFPASNSMLADAFPQERRARVMGWWNAALPVGVFMGYAAGGVIGQAFGWQAAFLVVGFPGLILATLAWSSREPARGVNEGLRATPAAEGPLGIGLLRIRSFAFGVLFQIGAYFALGGLSFWISVFLVRRYGFSTGGAGVVAGALFVVAGGVGTVAGGYLADQLLPRQPAARLLVPGVTMLAGGVAIALGLVAPSLPVFLVVYALAGALIQMQSAPFSAFQQDVVPPAARARAVALSLLLGHVFGDAFSPSLIGLLSEHLGGATGGGLERALWLAPLAAVLAGVAALFGARYAKADRERMLANERAVTAPALV